MYFSTVNPGMNYGGVMGDSKIKILNSIPQEYVPKTIYISTSSSISQIKNLINKNHFSYPFIVKPDVGERGKGVELISSEEELSNYLKGKTEALMIQEYIEGSLELGIFYHRMPREKHGKISSIVSKGFLSVTGDGRSTLAELLGREIRADSRQEYLRRKFEEKISQVIPAGEVVELEPIGNHCRGTIFYDANHLINDQLQMVFDRIALKISGFYYGRFDIKVPSLEDLYAGQNIKIFELNGVSSEVAHIYDPDYKLLKAYREVVEHMNYIYQIAKINYLLGVPRDSLGLFIKELINHLKNH